MPKPVFTDYKDWKKRHLTECTHIVRPSERSTLSRTRLCFWSTSVTRCLWNSCPLGNKEAP